ncbi:two-component system, NarL family, sensor histidine kinase DesK [Saccharopolyspora antimicrobica]|uniref:Two-component system sensor histidine kinase DesK n=1 Tax=Saccharopolyspora antimicrobica TaxID=455193 RepID=A0A1I5EV59_9PSEU|nr:two-component system sensor histidine kinase DesK [Saccharopolyspora antimicrobica]SFO15293.1 two-component system, NarL family, sensor histidine kinase DesK [Saccharopolyspora antimicrobica]
MSDAVPVSTPEFDPRRIRRLRRYTWWSIVPMQPVYVMAPLLILVAGATQGHYSTTEVVLLALVAVASAIDGTWMATSLMQGLGHGKHRPVVHAVVFASALGAMAYTMHKDGTGALWSMVVSGLAGVHVSAAPYRWRWPLAIGTALAVAVIGTFASSPDNPLRGLFPGVFTAVLVSVVMSLVLAAVWFWDIVLELDRARTVSAELAVANERLRFAADLHDIQGHHLQVIALKGELTERLIGVDDATARASAAEIAEIARTALKDTREVVHGYRHTKLTSELENAREILEAAGVRTTVDGDATLVPPPLQPLFGALVREGTTNVLRHSRAENCELRIVTDGPRTSIVLRNDRVKPPNGAAGSGIEGLRQRFSAMGGHVEGRRVDDWFELSGAAELGRTS